jgi:hypothetical protein
MQSAHVIILFFNRFETSAKDNIGIDQAAKFLITKILENQVTKKPAEKGIIKPGEKTATKANDVEKKDEGSGCCK